MKRFDVVLPLYRPGEGWEKHIAGAITGLKTYFAGKDCELVFYATNDGAPSECYPEEKLACIRDAAGGNFHFIPYEVNQGKGYSLRFLISRCEGDYIVYTDGDFPFGYLPVAQAFELLDAGNDVVTGKRGRDYNGALSPVRKMLSKSVRLLNMVLLGLPAELRDTQAGLKGFNRRGREIFLKTTVKKFVFDTEFILMAWKNSLRIVPLQIRVRENLILSSMGLNVMVREFMSLLRVVWRVRVLRKF